MRYKKVEDVLLPTLRALSGDSETCSSDIRERVASELSLTEVERRKHAPNAPKKYTRFNYLVAWALVYLCDGGLSEKVSDGVYRLTSRGKGVLTTHRHRLSLRDLKSLRR